MTSAVEKVMTQAQTQKDKWKDRRRADAKKAPARRRGASSGTAAPPPDARTLPPAPRIRKVRYPVKPMTVDEAAGLLQDNGEAFLVFRNARTEAVSVVFRRNDGNLGLIETEQ
jgi:putative sigma-54 modulation protein